MSESIQLPKTVPLDHRGDIVAAARLLYPAGALMQQYRPYICPFEEIVRFVPQGAKVVDLGCGSGLLLGMLAIGKDIQSGVGIDPGTQALSRAILMKSRLPVALQPRIHFAAARDEVPQQWSECNVVTMIDVMHHVSPPEQRKFFDAAAQTLLHGGIFIYKDMCQRPLWRAWANRLHDLAMARQWIHYLPIAQLEKWAADAGLRLVHSATINRLWYGHELRVFQRDSA